jgi:hypothetical protein
MQLDAAYYLQKFKIHICIGFAQNEHVALFIGQAFDLTQLVA